MKVISFLGATECPKCRVSLDLHHIIEKTYKLNKNGSIIDTDNCYEEEYLECPNCGKFYEFVEKDRGKMEIYTELQGRIDLYNMIENPIDINSPFVRRD